MSLKQYRASIDVSMGGRMAEELGASLVCASRETAHLCVVYGPESVTSGCSSDLQNATNIAKAMVRVRRHLVRPRHLPLTAHSIGACLTLSGRYGITPRTPA